MDAKHCERRLTAQAGDRAKSAAGLNIRAVDDARVVEHREADADGATASRAWRFALKSFEKVTEPSSL